MLNVVMIGPQGSGKGTQSDRLSAQLGIPHISLGTLFRTEVGKGTDLGKTLAEIMGRGEIVPIEVADQVIIGRLQQRDAEKGVILDGYPRTLEQADSLDNILSHLGKKLTHVIYLNITDEEALKRLTGRRVCTNTACERNYHLEYSPPKTANVCDHCGSGLAQRKDDHPEAIQHRLSIYHTETTPLIALYQGLGVLHEVQAMRPIDEVSADIAKALGT